MSEPKPSSAPRNKPFVPYQRPDRPLKVLRDIWKSTIYNANSNGIERVCFTSPKQEGQRNPSSLASALDAYPSLADSFDPDLEGIQDAQQSFENLVNRAVLVFDIANTVQGNAGLIEF